MATWETVIELGLALPEAEESTYYGRPTLKVDGKMFVSFRDQREVIVVRIGPQEKDFLVFSAPEKYFVTPHFDNYPSYVLAWLDKLEREELRELLTEAWLFVAPKRLAVAFESAESSE